MGVAVRVNLRGNRRLRRAIRRLGRPERNPADRRALRLSARLVRRKAQREYLSGQVLGYITGELHDSIEVDVRGLPDFVDVGTPLPQAGPLHFGWPSRGMPPRPFLEPPLLDAVPEMGEIWLQEIDRELAAVT